MKNIEKGSIKYLLLLLVIYVSVGLILYPILDFLYYKLITKSNFVYSIQADVIKPIAICSIMGICSWFMEKNKNKRIYNHTIKIFQYYKTDVKICFCCGIMLIEELKK